MEAPVSRVDARFVVLLDKAFDPAIVTHKLGIAPTELESSGEGSCLGPSRKETHASTRSRWLLASGSEATWDADDQIYKVLQLLKDKTRDLLELRREYSAQFVLEIVVEIEEGRTPAVILNRDILRYLAHIGAGYEVDLRVCSLAKEDPNLDAIVGIRARERLEADVVMLAETIGERHLGRPDRLTMATNWIRESLAVIGYEPSIHSFEVDGEKVQNVEVVRPGRDPNLGALVVGAHYDTVPTSPGADDNASGVAALLEIARSLKELQPERTVRLVFFVNEEWPHFQTETMGSLVYAKACRERNENIAGMIALESLAYYSNEPGSQTYPSPELSTLFPDTGNFLALVGNEASAPFLEQFREAFPKDCPVPIQAIALPEASRAVGWSDHWSFWQSGYPAVMVTDTVPFRNPHYHQVSDTVSTLCLGEFADVTWGLVRAIRKLCGLGPR